MTARQKDTLADFILGMFVGAALSSALFLLIGMAF